MCLTCVSVWHEVWVWSDRRMMGRRCESRLISLDKPHGASEMNGVSLFLVCLPNNSAQWRKGSSAFLPESNTDSFNSSSAQVHILPYMHPNTEAYFVLHYKFPLATLSKSNFSDEHMALLVVKVTISWWTAAGSAVGQHDWMDKIQPWRQTEDSFRQLCGYYTVIVPQTESPFKAKQWQKYQLVHVSLLSTGLLWVSVWLSESHLVHIHFSLLTCYSFVQGHPVRESQLVRHKV